MYRPQFAYPPPPNDFEDVDFVYSFDETNVPALDVRFSPGQTTQRIPLPLQSDAAFLLRGLQMNPAPANLAVQIWDAFDKPISDDFVPPSIYSVSTVNPVAAVEPELQSPPGASYQLSILNKSGTESVLMLEGNTDTAPVLIDPVNFGSGYIESTQLGNTPFLFNGVLYFVGTSNTPAPFTLNISKSMDAGKTWQLVGQTQTTNFNAAPFFDGDHSIIIAVSTSAREVSGTINLQNFDLDTETWGAVYGVAGAPTTFSIYSAGLRPDGSIIVLHSGPRAGAVGTGSGLFAAIFAAGAWSTNFDAGTGITTLPSYDSVHDFAYRAVFVVNPATGDSLVFFTTHGNLGPPNWEGRGFFQLITSTNTLGTFFDFPGNDGVGTTALQSICDAPPIIVGNNVLLGISYAPAAPALSYSVAALIIGVGLTAPVFSYQPAPYMDPQFSANNGAIGQPLTQSPCLFFDGRTIFGVYAANRFSTDFSPNEVRLCYTNNPLNPGSGWTASTIFATADQLPDFRAAGQELFHPTVTGVDDLLLFSVGANSPPSSGNTFAQFFLGLLEIVPLRIQFRGVKRFLRKRSKQVCAT